MKRKSSSKITVKSKSDPTNLAVKAGIIIGVLLVIVIGANFLMGQNTTKSPGSPGTTYSPDDLFSMCIEHATIAKHYHWELEIFISGEKQNIPANIGIQSNCMRPIHTHDISGTVHVELPEGAGNLKPTIGDFFTIWGETLSSSELLGQQGVLKASINGQTYNAAVIVDYAPSNGDAIVLSLES